MVIYGSFMGDEQNRRISAANNDKYPLLFVRYAYVSLLITNGS